MHTLYTAKVKRTEGILEYLDIYNFSIAIKMARKTLEEVVYILELIQNRTRELEILSTSTINENSPANTVIMLSTIEASPASANDTSLELHSHTEETSNSLVRSFEPSIIEDERVKHEQMRLVFQCLMLAPYKPC